MMIDDVLNTDAILDAFASAGRVLPREALKQAADNWPEVAPPLLAILEAHANGTALTERSEAILFYGIYLMAQMRETRAFRPISVIAAGNQMEVLIGDGVTDDLPLILIRTYDGDPAPLHLLIEAAGADEFTRDAGMSALAWLTATGRIDRDETARYLRDLHATLQPQEESWVWVGWQQAIANLGLKDLVPLVEEAFENGWIEEFALGIDDFHDNLRKALLTSDPAKIFHSQDRDDGHLDDAVAHLTPWYPEKKPAPPQLTAPTNQYAAAPLRNPYRDVGRNDPCPCGSGKKFKKCCLGAAT